MDFGVVIDSFHLKLPAIFAVIGSSRSGKTTWVRNLFRNLHDNIPNCPEIVSLILVFRHYQPLYQEIVNHIKDLYPAVSIKIFEEWPEKEILEREFWPPTNERQQSLIIIDDVGYMIKGEAFEALCRGISHHCNVSVFFLSQDLSSESKRVKNALKNANYFVLTKSSQHGPLLRDLQMKLFPYQKGYLSFAYEELLTKSCEGGPYGYCVIDKQVSTEPKYSVKTGVLHGENGYIFM